MEIKCGTDIIEIDRIRDSIEKMGERFVKRVFTKNEIEYCESKKAQKYQHYAARFAAKEATFKAISEELDNKNSICWKDFEVINDENGKPRLNIICSDLGNIISKDISISHCKEYAVANVIILKD